MVFLTFTRKNLFVFLLVIIVLLAVFGEIMGVSAPLQSAKTNKDRVEFAEGIGHSINESCIDTKRITLPYDRNDGLYKNVSDEGYRLCDYAGSTVTVYSYTDLDGKGVLDIFVYRNRVIGYKWKNNGLTDL